jgi:8-oxo-dGTP pyrophosphatase MutT (NUDIX family)
MRKTFYINDNESVCPVMAAGVLIYKVKKNIVSVLLSKSRDVYEDLGGRVDLDDDTIFDTVVREAFEETNENIDKSKIKKRLKTAEHFYTKKSKYVVYLIKANNKEKKLKSVDFGEKEIHDNIYRKIKWTKIYDMMDSSKIKLNFRLLNKKLLDKLKSIQDEYEL